MVNPIFSYNFLSLALISIWHGVDFRNTKTEYKKNILLSWLLAVPIAKETFFSSVEKKKKEGHK